MLVKFASLAVLLALAGCGSVATKPDTEEPADQQATAAEETSVNESSYADIDSDTLSIYKHGLKLLKSGNYKQALIHWTRMSENNPDFPGVWVNLSLAQSHNDDYESAKASIETALELKPGFCPALIAMGPVERQLGEFLAAEDYYKQAITCSSGNSADLHYNLGILYDLYLNEPAKALMQYKAAQRQYKNKDEQLEIWITDLTRRQEAQLSSQPQPETVADGEGN